MWCGGQDIVHQGVLPVILHPPSVGFPPWPWLRRERVATVGAAWQTNNKVGCVMLLALWGLPSPWKGSLQLQDCSDRSSLSVAELALRRQVPKRSTCYLDAGSWKTEFFYIFSLITFGLKLQFLVNTVFKWSKNRLISILLAFFYFGFCCTGQASNSEPSAATSAVVFCNSDRNDLLN